MARRKNIFTKLEQEAFRAGITPRTRQSIEWFRQKAATLQGVSRQRMLSSDPLYTRGTPTIGHMVMFFYDPKHKKTLPYYDRFPLSIIIDGAPGGFLGLNLHYLPPVLRARLLDQLMAMTSDKRYDDRTAFNATYNMLKGASGNKYYKPCIKHYLGKHIKSKVAHVPAPEWEIATFLPTQSFAKGSEAEVWRDSRNKI